MRKPVLAVGAAALIIPLSPAPAGAATTAAETGLFASPFVEPDGVDCVSAIDPRPRCKATANAIAQLPTAARSTGAASRGWTTSRATRS